MKRYKFFNILFVLCFFNLPAAIILWNYTRFEIFLFVQLIGLMLVLGYLIPFRQKLALKYDPDILKRLLYFFWWALFLIVAIKIEAVGLPGEIYYGRAYEEAFMTTYAALTKLYLFSPVVSSALIILERRLLYRILLAALSLVMILIPGVKGNAFLFLFILIFYNLLVTPKLVPRLMLLSLIVPLVTLSLFFASHFVIRSASSEVFNLDTANRLFETIWLYIEPNYKNLALTIDRSEIFQFGAVFMFPIVETLTLGLIRTIGDGQIWYFVDPSLKAGTFARDFWQDWGVMAPLFVFLLGMIFSWLSGIVDGHKKVNRILISILSFPFAFVFFYNEFSRNQIVFGFLLVIMLAQVARHKA